MLLDHVILSVGDLARSNAFYKQALRPLGITDYWDYEGKDGHPDLKGFGQNKIPGFWIKQGKFVPEAVHIAFVAKSQDAVNEVYAAAMSAGARDNGKPGARLQYDPRYYAGNVFDPDGYSLEVVYKPWLYST